MALIVLPEGQQRSGKQGGVVFSHNAGGPYVRNRAIPVNPQTDRQVAVRNATRALSIAWGLALTANQRAAWDVYAAAIPWFNRLGQAITLKGLNMYVRSNVARLVDKLTRIDDAPTDFFLAPAELQLAVTATEAAQTLDVGFDDTAGWANEDDAFQWVYVGRPQNASRNFFKGPFRLAGTIAGDSITPPTSPDTIASPWPIAEGQRIWVYTRIGLADGRLSDVAQVNFLCAA
jgi:hypothetical protein